jgi:hypothetical protein
MVQKQWLPKPALAIPVAVKPVAPKPVAKPVAKPKAKSDRNLPLVQLDRAEQIASLEAQLAALKSLNVSTSQEKVS